MSSELQPYEPHHEVDSWSAVMPQVVKLAEYVADTEFIPKTLRGRPAAIAAAILSGREMGIGPMRALAHVHMVDGRPSLSAEQKRAAALAAGHDIVYVETTVTRCVVKGRRRGAQEWSTVTWTIDDAKNAGLAGKDNWRKHPRRMLQARATGELVDLLFPDASAGLGTTEELEDGTDAAGITTDGHAPTARKRTARRATAVTQTSGGEKPSTPEGRNLAPVGGNAQPVDSPPLPGEDGYDDTPDPADPELITDDQLTKLHTVFTKVGWNDRDDRLRAAGIIVGRDIDSSKKLTKDEASALIDTLERCAGHEDPQVALTDLIDAMEAVEGEIVEDKA